MPWAEAPWRAWHELSAERAYVVSGHAAPMGVMMLLSRPLPIPWGAIQNWCDRAGASADERSEFIAPLVVALDREYLAFWQRQQGKPTPGDNAAAKLARFDKT